MKRSAATAFGGAAATAPPPPPFGPYAALSGIPAAFGGAGAGAGAGASAAGGSAAASTAAGGAPAAYQTLEFMPLGGGHEVGRSCLVVRFRGKTILLDCGVDPAFNGVRALPFFDLVDPAAIDIVIITHFHLDHCAALPYLTERLVGFRGRIYATHPTIAVMKVLLHDYIKVSTTEAGEPEGLFSGDDIEKCLNRIEAVDFHQTVQVDGIVFEMYHAGHVLGAAMVLLDVGGTRLLYTGDYSCEEDRHLMAAEVPKRGPIDVLVVESTHGKTKMETRETREKRFTEAVERVLARGGRCLIPVFALGRAQELMLILDEMWASRPDLQRFPLYHVSGKRTRGSEREGWRDTVANKGLDVYRTFVGQMSGRLQASMVASDRNPWAFRHVLITDPSGFKDTGPCVVFASPGMLQQGFARQLFDKWCEDSRNGVVLTGFSAEGTLARELEAQPTEVVSAHSRKMVRRIGVDRISFTAHADMVQTARFIDACAPANIILVHGERTEMRGLFANIRAKYGKTTGYHPYMPSNTERVDLRFRDDHLIQLMGTLAAKRLAAGATISGLLVQRQFRYVLVSPSDLGAYTDLTQHSLEQTMHVPWRSPFAILALFLRGVFETVAEEAAEGAAEGDAGSSTAIVTAAPARPRRRTLLVERLVRVSHVPPDRVIMRWQASPLADALADAVATVVAHAEANRTFLLASRAMRTHQHLCEGHDHDGDGDAAAAGAATAPPAKRPRRLRIVEESDDDDDVGDGDGDVVMSDSRGHVKGGDADDGSGEAADAAAGLALVPPWAVATAMRGIGEHTSASTAPPHVGWLAMEAARRVDASLLPHAAWASVGAGSLSLDAALTALLAAADTDVVAAPSPAWLLRRGVCNVVEWLCNQMPPTSLTIAASSAELAEMAASICEEMGITVGEAGDSAPAPTEVTTGAGSEAASPGLVLRVTLPPAFYTGDDSASASTTGVAAAGGDVVVLLVSMPRAGDGGTSDAAVASPLASLLAPTLPSTPLLLGDGAMPVAAATTAAVPLALRRTATKLLDGANTILRLRL